MYPNQNRHEFADLPFNIHLNLLTEFHLIVQHIRDTLPHGPMPLFSLASLLDPLISLLFSEIVLRLLDATVSLSVVFVLLLIFLQVSSDVFADL